MKTTKEQNSAIKIIAHCIQNDEKGVREILKKNGVDTSFVLSKSDLTNVFMDALARSKSFALDFIKYVKSKQKTYNANGREPVFTVNELTGSGIKEIDLTGISSPPEMTHTTVDPVGNNGNNDAGGFFSGIRLIDLINTGVGVLQTQRDIQVSKNNKDAVTEAVKVERDKINLKPDTTTQGNATIYVVAGLVGITLIGTLIYFIKKK